MREMFVSAGVSVETLAASEMPLGILEVSLGCCSATYLVSVFPVVPGLQLAPCHCPLSIHLGFIKGPLPINNSGISH